MYTVIPKLVVESLRFQELVVSAMLHNLSVINDVDLVDVLDGGQSVGDSDGGSSDLSSVQSVLNDLNRKNVNSPGLTTSSKALN